MKIVKSSYSNCNREINLVELTQKSHEFNQKTVLVIGVVHGDEPQGKFLIEQYINKQNADSQSLFKNRMLFIPCLNPDGLENKTRQNENMIDINRNFPTKNWEKIPFDSEYFGGENSSSEPETQFVMDVLEEFSPDVILTMHAPFKIVNYDGPADEIAKEISSIIGYPVQKDVGYPTLGSFGTYAGIERNIPVITLELDEEIDVNELIEPMDKVFDYLALRY